MEAWRKIKVDPSMKIEVVNIPQHMKDEYCITLREWSRNVSMNDLCLIAQKAYTSVMYFNQVKRGHQIASKSWNNRMVNAAKEIVPEFPIMIEKIWL